MPPARVLFVGNSLTYVGNVPAVFESLAAANGRTVASDMIVTAGATLAERFADGSVARALASAHYDVVILQERGGDLMSAFGPESNVQSREAIKRLAAIATANGAKAALLGSYQTRRTASEELVSSESSAAADAAIPYIEVSQKLQRLRKTAPDLKWFAADGMHPGPALALLDAVAVYREVFGSSPRPRSFTVRAPIYGASSGLSEAVRPAAAPPPREATPREFSYPLGMVERIVYAAE